LAERERQLLERLAAEGKQTRLALGEIETAKLLEMSGLVFIARDTAYAVITPKGRHALAGPAPQAEPKRKPPLGFLE
jgi:hypothetical protein